MDVTPIMADRPQSSINTPHCVRNVSIIHLRILLLLANTTHSTPLAILYPLSTLVSYLLEHKFIMKQARWILKVTLLTTRWADYTGNGASKIFNILTAIRQKINLFLRGKTKGLTILFEKTFLLIYRTEYNLTCFSGHI